MSNEHTPTPWSMTDAEDDDVCIFGADDGWLANLGINVPCEWADQNHTFIFDLNKANARRIVACVNALDGISTDFLENTTPRTVRILIENTARMERLEAELRQLKSSIEYVHGDLNRLDAAKILEDIEAVI